MSRSWRWRVFSIALVPFWFFPGSYASGITQQRGFSGIEPAVLVYYRQRCDRGKGTRPAREIEDVISGSAASSTIADSKEKPEFENTFVTGKLTLSHLRVGQAVRFEDVVFCDGLEIVDSQFESEFSFEKVIILNRDNPLTRLGNATLTRNSVAGSFRFARSHAAFVDAEDIVVRRNIQFFDNHVGQINFRRAAANGTMNFPGTIVETDDRYLDLLKSKNKTRLSYTDLGQMKVGGRLNLNSMQVPKNLILFGGEAEIVTIQCSNVAAADFRELHVARSFTIVNSNLGRTSPATGKEPKGFCSEINTLKNRDYGLLAKNLNVGSDFIIGLGKKCTHTGAASQTKYPTHIHDELCMENAKIGGTLDISGSEMAFADFSNISVGNTFVLSDRHSSVKWKDISLQKDECRAQLDLRGARLNAVASCFSQKDWPEARRWLIKGAKINSLHPATCNGTDEGSLSVSQLSSILDALLKDSCFKLENVGPYRTFSRPLSQDGLSSVASDVSFFERQRSTAESSGPFAFTKGKIQELLGGYGIRTIYPAIAALMFAMVGTVVTRIANPVVLYSPNSSVIKWREKRKIDHALILFECFIFSVDRLIPILTINKKYKDYSIIGNPYRIYFYFHSVMGWLLAGAAAVFVTQAIGLA